MAEKSLYDQLVDAERDARVRDSTALEQELYRIFGLEPGLDRASFLPIAGRGSDRQLAAPGVLYDILKTLAAPGAAAKGIPVSTDEAVNTATNVMGGGLGAPGVGVEGAFAGMAAKPKGGVFLPPNLKSGLGSLVDQYAEKLGKLGLDRNEVTKKARKYFTTTYGTNEDPLRTAVLESRLNIKPDEAAVRGRMDFRDYLVDAARKQHTATSSTQQKIKSGELPTDTPLDADALVDFHTLYDRRAGIRPTIYKKQPEYDSQRLDTQRLYESLSGERVPDELRNPESYFMSYEDPAARLQKVEQDLATGKNAWSRDRLMSEKALYESLLGKGDAPDQTLSRAAERGEVVYDIASSPDLPFLKPEAVARGAKHIPPETAARMSFPELVVAASKNLERYGDFDAIVTAAERGKPVPKEYWLDRGVTPLVSVGDKRWVRIVDPEYTRLESAHMGHSVRGYADNDRYGVGSRGPTAILDGSAQIYSLRDAKTGKPSVTVEVETVPGELPEITQIKGPRNARPSDEDMDAIFALFDKLGVGPSNINSEMYSGEPYFHWGIEYANRLKGVQRKATGGLIDMPSNYSKGRWRLI